MPIHVLPEHVFIFVAAFLAAVSATRRLWVLCTIGSVLLAVFWWGFLTATQADWTQQAFQDLAGQFIIATILGLFLGSLLRALAHALLGPRPPNR